MTELSEVLLDNQRIIGINFNKELIFLETYKEAHNKIKQEKMAIQGFKDQIASGQFKKGNAQESKLSMKFIKHELPKSYANANYILEGRVDSDTPMVITDINLLNPGGKEEH